MDDSGMAFLPYDDDTNLGHRFLDGDGDAARALYLRYYERLVRFAFSYIQSRASAEDIVQEVFFAIWERRDLLQFQHGIRVYLYSAVRNRALKHVDHERVRERTADRMTEWTAEHEGAESMVPGMGTAFPLPDAMVDANDLSRRIARIILSMPERRRQALTLRVQHELPYTEIAQIMGISVEAATIHVARARDMIAKETGR